MENNTSDARQTPPSFDELVSMIKKLFADYLEDYIKAKPSEIKKSWERYKTLNHLYRDGQPEQTGAVWVKASDGLPGWKKRVKWRDGNDHSYATDGEISLFEMDKPNLEGWEWLDESAAANESRTEQQVVDGEFAKIGNKKKLTTLADTEEVTVWAEKNGFKWQNFEWCKDGERYPLDEIIELAYIEKRAGEMLPKVAQAAKEAEYFLTELKKKFKQQKEK